MLDNPANTFQINRPVVARRDFLANGVRYRCGDAFDWQRKALSVRKVQQLFDAGYLTHIEDAPKRKTTKTKTTKKQSRRKPQTSGARTEPEDTEQVEELKKLARGDTDAAETKTARAKLVAMGKWW